MAGNQRVGILSFARTPSWSSAYMAKSTLYRVGVRSHVDYALRTDMIGSAAGEDEYYIAYG